MIVEIRQGLHEDGFAVSISQLCRWFGIPRRTVYYKATKKLPTVHPRIASAQMLPNGGVASREMLLAATPATMQPPQSRRIHGHQDDTHGAG